MSESQESPIPISQKRFRKIYVPFVDPTEARSALAQDRRSPLAP
jgi:hypothetical protein